MMNYEELVDALRYCVRGVCKNCSYFDKCKENGTAMDQLHNDAAAAIEELQDKVVEREEELNDADVAADDNGRQVEELQAEIERLKDSNEELRERQTYIDHYGIEWLTSAKDVPNYAYEHGYADGMAEVNAQLPKRGKWITIRLNNGGSYTGCSCCEAPIPTDTMLDYIPESESKYCYSCGAKMEVQDGANRGF